MAWGKGNSWRDLGSGVSGVRTGDRLPLGRGRPVPSAGVSSLPVPSPARKYFNHPTVASGGVHCDSKTEAARWNELCALQAGHAISHLLPHPSFPIYVNGQRTGRITFDAGYVEHGEWVCEDTKSGRTSGTAAFRQRLRDFQACYPHIRVHIELR